MLWHGNETWVLFDYSGHKKVKLAKYREIKVFI